MQAAVRFSLIMSLVCSSLFADNYGSSQPQKYRKLMNYNLSSKCTQNGGKMMTKYTGSHKPYQICIFEDNRQCEVKALKIVEI